MNTKQKGPQMLTAAERRFVREVHRMMRMPLNELLTVERNRMAVGI